MSFTDSGKNIKITGLLLGIFFLSVILVNILMPAFQHEISEEYVGQHARTIYESEEPGSERILCIDDNEEAFLWRLRMIGNAKESIVLATFDLRDDVWNGYYGSPAPCGRAWGEGKAIS